MSSEKVEVKLTEDERKCLRDLCRRAFADRLSDDQRRMLVEAFVDEEDAQAAGNNKVAVFRSHVEQLRWHAEDSLVIALTSELGEFCGRKW